MNMILQTRPINESIISTQSEAEFARDRRAAGAKIIESKGRFWEEIRFGFYQSVHWLSRMSAVQAVQPTLFCWGYRTTLAETDATAANGAMFVHLLQDVSNYDLELLDSRVRKHLRKSRKLVEVFELTGPALLKAEGFEVLRSSWTRTGYSSLPTKSTYQAAVAKTFTTKSIILAGIINGKLGGYLEGYAVGSTAYMQNLIVATEYLSTQIGTLLRFEFVQVCRRSGEIREVVSGQHSREVPNLVAYKENTGFPVVKIPSVVHINPIIGPMLRRTKPHVYYRLTGRE